MSRNSGVPLTAINPRYHAQVVAQLHGTAHKPTVPQGNLASAGLPGAQKPRLQQDGKGPNKTEAAFVQWLREQNCSQADRPILEQAVTLKLANGVRYTPDVFCPLPVPTFYEVKGFMRDDAAVKIKVAAHLFPWFMFYLVTKRTKKQGGGWQVDRVLP